MRANWIVIGALMGALGVGLGAFGAHGIKDSVGPEQLAWWETGTQYHLFHAPVIVLFGLLRRGAPGGNAAGWALLAGILIFSGTLYAMALGAPRWFGAITPIGGLLLIVGWVLLALAARRPYGLQSS